MAQVLSARPRRLSPNVGGAWLLRCRETIPQSRPIILVARSPRANTLSSVCPSISRFPADSFSVLALAEKTHVPRKFRVYLFYGTSNL